MARILATSLARLRTAGCPRSSFASYGITSWHSRSRGSVAGEVLKLESSAFSHLLKGDPTDAIYAGTPIDGLSQFDQGKWLQEWARETLQTKHPAAEILDPERGTCCNGSPRSFSQAPYDFLMGGRRVEVKSSRLRWSFSHRCWRVSFYNLKLPAGGAEEAALEDLYLVILYPLSKRHCLDQA